MVSPGSVSHQVGVVGGGGVGDRPGKVTILHCNTLTKRTLPGTPAVQVAEVVAEFLNFVGVKVGVIPEDVVVAGPGGALDPLVGDQVEVTLQVNSEVRQ